MRGVRITARARFRAGGGRHENTRSKIGTNRKFTISAVIPHKTLGVVI